MQINGLRISQTMLDMLLHLERSVEEGYSAAVCEQFGTGRTRFAMAEMGLVRCINKGLWQYELLDEGRSVLRAWREASQGELLEAHEPPLGNLRTEAQATESLTPGPSPSGRGEQTESEACSGCFRRQVLEYLLLASPDGRQRIRELERMASYLRSLAGEDNHAG